MQISELSQLTADKISSSTAHHCYIVQGDSLEILDNFKNQIITKTSVESNQNILEIKTDKKTYQVNDFALAYRFCEMATKETRLIFINDLDKLSEITSNKLLKILEETPKNIYFFLLWKGSSKILPTIISRSVVIKITNNEKEKKSEINNALSGFLNNEMELHQFLEKYKNEVDAVYQAIINKSNDRPHHDKLINLCNAIAKDTKYRQFNQASLHRLAHLLGQLET